MSLKAITTVRERSRAKGSDRLVLFGIADVANDDGREAFPSTRFLVQWSRLTDRNVRLVLHRLERQGEILIEPNLQGRTFTRRDGSVFVPKWYLHIRCLCAWEAYQAGEPAGPAATAKLPAGRPRKPEKISGSRVGKSDRQGSGLRPREPEKISHSPGRGRGSGQSEKISDSRLGAATETGNLFRETGSPVSNNRKIPVPHIRKDPSSDPSFELVQGAAPPAAPVDHVEKSAATEPASDHLAVITKLAHETIDLLGMRADLGELAETVKSRCAQLQIAYDSDVVRKAVDSAVFQRQHLRKEAG